MKAGSAFGGVVASRRLLAVFVSLFVASCVIDPQDLLFRMKVPLFCACWGIFLLFYLPKPERYRIPMGLLLYVAAMIVIPAGSIGYYYLIDGSHPYEGFLLFKAYILVGFAVLLYLLRIDALKATCVTLTAMSWVIVIVAVLVKMEHPLAERIQDFGKLHGILDISTRNYGSDFSLLLVFFVISPMLGLPIAYYTDLALTSSGGRRLWCWGMTFLNCFAMFTAGSRTNLLTAVLLPVVLVVLHKRRKILLAATVAVIVVVVGAIYYWNEILILFSAEEMSNRHKLTLLEDYWALFSDPMTLLFGQGLGAYHYWTPRGYEFYVTELTFLDTIRFFGLFQGAIIIGLLLYPVYYIVAINPRFSQRHMIVAYGAYLVACSVQPFLFSSMGMLMLAIVMANIYMEKNPRGGSRRAPMANAVGLKPEGI